MNTTLMLLFLLLIAIPATYAQEKESRFQKELKLNISFQFAERSHTLGSLAPVALNRADRAGCFNGPGCTDS